MSLGEGVSCRIAYKAYSTGAIQSNVQPDSSINPGATDGQILRRTSSTLSLTKDTYQSAEVRTDRQIGDYRHGVKRVTGSLNGELSPGTYWDFVEAVLRGTGTAAVAKSEAELTSVAADNATSKFTFGGADPVTEGYRVGMVIRFTNLSEALNNAKNFLITDFGGASNRDVSVHPAPTTMSADTAFNVTSVGKRVFTPASGHVSRKFAIEHYFADLDIYELFTECRVGGMNFNLPATGMATVEIPIMGRDMETGSAGSGILQRDGPASGAHPARCPCRAALAARGLPPSRSHDLGARQPRSPGRRLPHPLPGLAHRRTSARGPHDRQLRRLVRSSGRHSRYRRRRRLSRQSRRADGGKRRRGRDVARPRRRLVGPLRHRRGRRIGCLRDRHRMRAAPFAWKRQ